jgi:hypothetical protein
LDLLAFVLLFGCSSDGYSDGGLMFTIITTLVFLILEAAILYYVRVEYLESHSSTKLLKTLIELLKHKRPGKATKRLIKEVLNVGIKGN